MTENAYFTTLTNRGLVKVSGPERRAFLQGLVSNDVNLLDTQPCVYACLLTPQGKFLHDFFITEKDETIFLDCEGGARAQDLVRRLSIYKLRANVKIECEAEIKIYAAIGAEIGYPDPRCPEMGYRSFEKPKNLEEKPFEAWDHHRILLIVPDGSRDMIPEKSTLLESNLDKLNGVSFEKGCYVGQELTARMHYRGLAKKHLYAIQNEKPLPAFGSEIRINDQLIGEMRSSCGNAGLALMKDELKDLFTGLIVI